METKYLYSFYLISALLLIAANWMFLWISKKNGHDDPFTIPIVLMISGVFCAIIVYLWTNAPQHEQYYWMVMSILSSFLGVATLVKTLVKYYESIIGFRDEVKQQAEKLDHISNTNKELEKKIDALQAKTDTIGIWTQNELLHSVSVKVYNMDDYIINLPFLLSQKSFRAENLKIMVENCYTDKKAIEKVVKHGGIAIVDPYYVKEVTNPKNEELVILSPLVIRNPIKCLEHSNQGEKVLVYDKSPQSTSGLLFPETGLNNNMVVSLKDFVKSLLDIIKNKKIFGAILVEKNEKLAKLKEVLEGYIKQVSPIQQNNESDNPIEWYEIFIYILSLWVLAPETNKELDLKELEKEFEKYSKLYLMEPELTMIQKFILSPNLMPNKDEIKRPEGNNEYRDIIFTAVITTKKYLRAYPLVVLKFLKAVRVGILRCHSVLNEGNSDVQSNSINYISDEIKKNYLGSTSGQQYKDAVLTILERLAKLDDNSKFDIKNLYPNDLVIFGNDDSTIYTIRLKKRDQELANFILNQETLDDDLKKKVQFIRDGLGI